MVDGGGGRGRRPSRGGVGTRTVQGVSASYLINQQYYQALLHDSLESITVVVMPRGSVKKAPRQSGYTFSQMEVVRYKITTLPLEANPRPFHVRLFYSSDFITLRYYY